MGTARRKRLKTDKKPEKKSRHKIRVRLTKAVVQQRIEQAKDDAYAEGHKDGRDAMRDELPTARGKGWVAAKLDTFRIVAQCAIKDHKPFWVHPELAALLVPIVLRELINKYDDVQRTLQETTAMSTEDPADAYAVALHTKGQD